VSRGAARIARRQKKAATATAPRIERINARSFSYSEQENEIKQ